MSEEELKTLVSSIIKDQKNNKETWTAMVARIEKALEALHNDLEVQHRDMFAQLTRMEIDGAILTAHRRKTNGVSEATTPHKRSFDNAWRDKLLIAALAAMAGTQVLTFIKGMFVQAPIP